MIRGTEIRGMSIGDEEEETKEDNDDGKGRGLGRECKMED